MSGTNEPPWGGNNFFSKKIPQNLCFSDKKNGAHNLEKNCSENNYFLDKIEDK